MIGPPSANVARRKTGLKLNDFSDRNTVPWQS
jgi:hypothetical protein